jgi:predicted ATPase
MIKSISINNFKSIVDLKLPLGQFNVLIGENGCGKSNILESIAFSTAALSNKLEREYFANRGIRYADSTSILSAFSDSKRINIEIDFDHIVKKFSLYFDSNDKSGIWKIEEDKERYLQTFKEYIGYDFDSYKNLIDQYVNSLKLIKKDMSHSAKDEITKKLNQIILEIEKNNEIINKGAKVSKEISDHLSFLIFSIEESVLRKFDAENAIHPLGRNGEGLFAYLKEISQKEDGINLIKEIKENLFVLDWFDDLEIPNDQLSNEFSLRLKDRYVEDTIRYFDQRSTNEGFLYLLFYLTLFISSETPAFFAIDNIESSFNPKLCREITKRLISLAKEHNKQVIVTTHSPAVLDGLNIANDDERLFVVRRNIDGYTKINRIEYKESLNMPLSEAWMKGYIGGLPDNF